MNSSQNIFLFVLILSSCLQADQRDDWFSERRGWIEQSKITKSADDMQNLARIVTGIGRNLESANLETSNLYYQAQSEFISISGHAKHYANRVTESRDKSKDFITDLEYHKACETLLKTLRHLPSPETVWVLGKMLESDADLLTREERLEVMRRAANGGQHEWYFPAGMAMLTFQELEIRNRPSGSGPNGTYTSEKDLVLLREWWEKIKSGETVFSFKGQAVEYRFKPDGTWDTIPIVNPPDDGPRFAAASAGERPIKRPVTAPQAAQEMHRGVSWWWYGIGGIALLALGAWFWSRNRSA